MYAEEFEDYEYEAEAYEPTGDPRLDAENERYTGYGSAPQYAQYTMPDVIKKFIIYFREMVNSGKLYEIQNVYENTFPKLTEEHFKSSPWPEAEEVSPLVDDDLPFLILYKELYYRHIYARIQGGPTIEQRFESYYNYCQLFNHILSAKSPVVLELPHQWLWEIIDEFVYQFQSFALFRCSLHKKSAEELEFIRVNPTLWNIHSVLNVLYSLVDKSNINQQLEAYAKGEDPDTVAGEFGRRPLYKMLGYFSLVGLLRLHSLLGDFYQAVKVLENMELNKKTLYSRVPACQISTYYYVGFAYLMMRSYLRLYTTMPVAKMAAFLEMPETDFRTHLLCFKHKMKNVVWTKGTSGLDGELQSGSEVDFYIDGGMIHIADTKVARRYGDYFIRQIHKFEEINRVLKTQKV
uniref:EOG090X0665 n=1 Tax=Daphnia atkinsoni TaxID=342845 RepID=A0A4Y7M1C9_9CRUS|nr:EOG090X0665 [Daphnia atkinsoni]